MQGGISDESDDVDFQPPTPKRKVDKTRASRSPRQSCSPLSSPCAGNEEEMEDAKTTDAKTTRQERFEKMATKFGFSSPHEFAVHVTNVSKEERRKMLVEFNREKPKKNKKRDEASGHVEDKEKKADDEASVSSPDYRGSKKKKRNLPSSISKVPRVAKVPPKRRTKGVQFDDESPPKRPCSIETNSDHVLCGESSDSLPDKQTKPYQLLPSLNESADLESETCGYGSKEKDSVVHNSSKGVLSDPQPSPHGQVYQELATIDCNALVDKLLFDDSLTDISDRQSPTRSRPLHQSHSSQVRSTPVHEAHQSQVGSTPVNEAHPPQIGPTRLHETPPSSLASAAPHSSTPVSRLSLAKQQSDIKTNKLDTELNIDELLFGF